jgi:RNA polymerase sigma-70 factor (ECF subfamily)
VFDLESLYRAHAAEVRRFALFLSGDAALADDIVAETFVRLWGARERVELATVRGYLVAIARNVFLQERRRVRRHYAVPDDSLTDPEPGPARRAIARDDLAITLAALQELPEADRAALLMRADGGLSYEEIAATLGISNTAARVKVHRARLRLAAARAGNGPGAKEKRP